MPDPASAPIPASAAVARPSLAERAAACPRDASFALAVAYDGAPFAGFARQPGQLTVQGELERALEVLLRREAPVTCAGRTDAGVHARGQVVSFDADAAELAGRTARSLQRSLNALVDDRIAVTRVAAAPRGFSARFDAVEREYRYLLFDGPFRPVLFADRAWAVGKPLDVGAMAEAAAHLVGEHDFKSFCLAASAVGKPTTRLVREVAVERAEVAGEPVVVVRVTGNAFLHSMVRTMVGTLVAVGLGRRAPGWAAEVLAARERAAAGETAPACGLVFWRVAYEGAVGRLLGGGDAWERAPWPVPGAAAPAAAEGEGGRR
ncbi:tRNA pseudouridine(38-40) synthase TruA [Adlercreutzia faecimuris]|uniref:tRNA pseudouridine synthase A n=1 Tax=Adlercreutzia faecimuris TaxID=2897341 RepID=A0ABS9WGI4_9ACTN|nr:tRNA pseudouridine(38-40) synthase TruA [Adlercreutzia sp. JBNU-10]